MNSKGFTLIEVLTTLLILGVIVSLSVVMIRYNTEGAMEKSELVFIDTLRDAINIYINSDGKELKYSDDAICTIKNNNASVFEITETVDFEKVFKSKFKPILKEEFVNPANESISCNEKAIISLFRDSDFVYYYSVKVSDLECLKYYDSEYITNLPEGCI